MLVYSLYSYYSPPQKFTFVVDIQNVKFAWYYMNKIFDKSILSHFNLALQLSNFYKIQSFICVTIGYISFASFWVASLSGFFSYISLQIKIKKNTIDILLLFLFFFLFFDIFKKSCLSTIFTFLCQQWKFVLIKWPLICFDLFVWLMTGYCIGIFRNCIVFLGLYFFFYIKILYVLEYRHYINFCWDCDKSRRKLNIRIVMGLR